MDINNITNVGTDSSVWTMISLIVILGIIGFFIGRSVVKVIIKMVEDASGDDVGIWPHVPGAVARIVCLLGVFIAIIWLALGAYGPGTPVQLPPVEESGYVESLDEVPDEPVIIDRKPSVLKKVEEASSRTNEDEEIEKAVKRAIKLQNNRK